MAELTAHRCVFFDDDGWLEPVCACGRRAVTLTTGLADGAGDGVVVLLGADDGDAGGWALDQVVRRDELAISA